MQLTHYTDYGLRVLMYLALQADHRLTTITEIADHFEVPRNHLVKVVHRLGQLGYVHTVRGKGGGLRLGRAPQDIVIGRVVRDMESNMELIDCARPPCPLAGECALKHILNDAMQTFLQVLDGHTLAELTPQPEQLRTLLHWPVGDTR